MRNVPPGGWLLMGFALFLVAMFLGNRRHRFSSMVGIAVCFLLFGGAMMSLSHQRQQSDPRIQRLQQMRELGIQP